jgi:hypothetical protein
MMWLKELLSKISSCVGRGMNMQWWKSCIYFFVPLVVMSLNGHFHWMSPFLLGLIIMAVAVAKQAIWDVWYKGYEFDVLDVVMTVMAVALGILFTWSKK